MSGRSKLRNKMARRVLSGKVTVDEARARIGREMTRPRKRDREIHRGLEAVAAAVKSAGPITDQDLFDAISVPLVRPAITKAARPPRGEDPRHLLEALKSAAAHPVAAPVNLIPASSLTGAQRAVLRAAYEDPDPVYREACRAHIESTVGKFVIPC
jgi:hypothetical protein